MLRLISPECNLCCLKLNRLQMRRRALQKWHTHRSMRPHTGKETDIGIDMLVDLQYSFTLDKGSWH